MHFEIDSKALGKNHTAGELYSFYKVTGSSEMMNKDLAVYKSLLSEAFGSEYNREYNAAIKDLSPNEYEAYTDVYLKKRELIAEDFISNHNPCKEFLEWLEYDLKFRQWEDLMMYLWHHPFENQLNLFEFRENIPDSYFDFLDTWDIENKDYLKSIHYQEFLSEFYKYKNYVFYLENNNVDFCQ